MTPIDTTDADLLVFVTVLVTVVLGWLLKLRRRGA